MTRPKMATIVAAVTAAALLAACGSSSSSSSGASGGSSATNSAATSSGSSGSGTQVVNSAGPTAGRPPMTQFCGKKKISVGLVDGFGGNDWRKTVHYVFGLDTKQCPNITQTYYENANGNLQQYNSDMASLVSQGANVIVTYDDFGPSGLPAIRKAQKAGVQVVPYIADPGGTPGSDYTTFTGLNAAATGQQWAAWLNKALGGKGSVVMLGGTPGNTSSPSYLAGFKTGAKATPGLSLISDAPLTTNWTTAGEQQAMAGVLSKNPTIGGIMMDYLATYPAVLTAYQQAGVAPGPVAGFTSDNQDGCIWKQYHAKYPKWQMYSVDGDENSVSIALRKGIAAAEGLKDPEPDTLTMGTSIDTLAGKDPKCDPSLPPETDFTAVGPDGQPLTAAQIRQALGA
jgi:ribose transport system substrate-binding protein